MLRSRLFLLAIFAGAPLAAQSYGPGDQVLAIDAAAFRAYDEGYGGYFNNFDGYLYRSGASTASYIAPVTLPDGAVITQICYYAYDANPDASIFMQLEAKKLVPGGASPGRVIIPGTLIQTTFDIGYGVVCTQPLSYTFHTTADVDGDGTLEQIAHRITIGPLTPDGSTGFGGVRITWHRQVSPPPDTATFDDVPTSHPFFQYIEALAAAGITGGCGAAPPLYCPNGPVTRGQMAVFLAKALGLHWAN